MSDIVAFYHVILRDQSYNKVAIFDSWQSLSYSMKINDVGSFSLSLGLPDSRSELFELDGIVEIYRSIPGLGVDWYQEFIGLHRTNAYSVLDDGRQKYTSTGVTLEDFLARTIINYPEGTIKSYKNDKAETAIKEYVEENCGPTALMIVPYEREYDGVLPDFEVEADTGAGLDWEGDRAFANLLETIKDIAKLSTLDFGITWSDTDETFRFQVHPDQLGEDRTIVGLNTTTGLNGAGNAPVVFSLESGTIQNFEYIYDRIDESNVVSVLGDGDGSTREIQVRSTSAVSDSPWNRREVSRPQGGFISEMQFAGDELLEELKSIEVISFSPLQQSSQIYGKHFFMGDKVTIYFRGSTFNRRITGITNNVEGSGKITIDFSEY